MFTKNRDRLLEGDIAKAFFEQVLAQARGEQAVVGRALHGGWHADRSLGEPEEFSSEDQTAPVPPPDDPGNPTVNFHGEKRSNDTHESTTDPEARLDKKSGGQGSQAELSGPRADGEPQRAGRRTRELTQATGTAERDAALVMVEQIARRGSA